jgi:hypothetical protein
MLEDLLSPIYKGNDSYRICLYNRVYISSIKEWYPLCLSFSDLSGHKTLLILYQRNVWFVSINIGIYTLLLFNFWDRWKIETDPKMNSGWFETLSEQRSLRSPRLRAPWSVKAWFQVQLPSIVILFVNCESFIFPMHPIGQQPSTSYFRQWIIY